MTFQDWTPALIAVAAGLGAGIAARLFLIPILMKLASRTRWQYDDVLVASIRGPVVLWGLLIGARVALRLLDIERDTEVLFSRIALLIGILSVTWAIGKFAAGMTRVFAARGALPGVSLLGNVALFVVLIIGMLIGLQTIGIAITPVITALGVGGLAVGLALQDTLSNLFAGIRLITGGRIRPGDYIRMDSGHEGWVEDIAWSVTTMREGANDIIIVPNNKLAQAVVTNYSMPDAAQVHVVNLRVAQDSDLAAVEKAVLEAAAEAQRTAQGVADFTPVVRFQDFADYGVRLIVVLKVKSYPERAALQHEFIKILQPKFRALGIRIPEAGAALAAARQ